MAKNLQNSVFSKIIIWCAGTILIATGIATIIGWQNHSTWLIQINSNFAPLKYNEALCFIITGISLPAYLLLPRRFIAVFPALVGIFGLLTLLQYTGNLSFEIDELVFLDYIETQTSHPGRLSPNSALCFLIFSIGFCTLAFKRHPISTRLGLLNLFISVLGGLALAGYLFSAEPLYGWGAMTRMSIQGAVCYIVMGIGLSALHWKHSDKRLFIKPFGINTKVALLVSVSVIIAACSIWLLMYYAFNSTLLKQKFSEMTVETRRLGNNLSSDISEIHHDIYYLLNTATSKELISAIANETSAKDTARASAIDDLAGFFEKVIHSVPTFSSISYFEIGNGDSELFRINRVGNKAKTFRKEEIQEDNVHSSLEYIHYLIDQNRLTSMELIHPLTLSDGTKQPVLLVTVPITTSTPDNDPIALLVFTQDISRVLQRIKQSIRSKLHLYICNSNGDFILKPAYAQTSDSGKQKHDQLRNLFIECILSEDEDNYRAQASFQGKPGYKSVVSLQKMPYESENPGNFFVLGIEAPFEEVIAESKATRNLSLGVCIAVLFITLLFALYVSRGLITPLRQIAVASEAVGRGEDHVPLPTLADDEVGTLARSFEKMIEKVNERAKAYETEIQERKQIEAKLSHERNLLNKLMDNVPDRIYFKDRFGKYIRVNTAVAKQLNANHPSEMVGKSDFDYYTTEQAKINQEDEAKIIKSGEPIINKEERFLPLDGGPPTWYSTSKLPLLDDRGDIIGTFGISRNITDYKKAEMERENLLVELKEKNEDLGQMIYVASHDLRSPLVNIQGFSQELEATCNDALELIDKVEIKDEYIKEELSNTLNIEIPETLNFILASASKMDILLSGLLRLSRLGRDAVRFEELDMDALARNVASTFEYKIKESMIDFAIEPLPPCFGDRAQIVQVISNMFANAIKYLDPERPGVIKFSGKSDEKFSTYTIEDNGIGIRDEHQDIIFELFHRLNPENHQGEGLGLTVVKRIIERHHGKIWLQSKRNVGTRFFFTLPSYMPDS